MVAQWMRWGAHARAGSARLMQLTRARGQLAFRQLCALVNNDSPVFRGNVARAMQAFDKWACCWQPLA